MTLAMLVALLSQINVLMPTALKVVEAILEWFRAKHPEISNAELIAALRAHALENMAGIDAWIAAHPDA